ncbi:MAG: hypothetical protein K5Q00_02410, partial [Gammaproteobacteria bacterium]|nr:hypothetical protein [Gammaproteobacteria bacterium]
TQSWLTRPEEQLSDVHLLKKTVQRLIFLWLKGQHRYWKTVIPAAAKKVLWLHISDNIGDSLMRLAPIQLLAKHCQVDLYTSPSAANLFSAGSYFSHVYRIDADAAQVQQQHYDLVIIDALQTKPLKQKIAVAKDTPFVTLHELFHFCRDDYNPLYYCWWRMQYLLREFSHDNSEPKRVMDIPVTAVAKISNFNIPKNSIAVAVGGREAYRTYHAWEQVIRLIAQQQPEQHFILLGSDNGAETAQVIKAVLPTVAITNLVAQCSLVETAAILQRCQMLLCADGGLLHVAAAVSTKTVSLFAEEYPDLRYVADDDYLALRVERHVNEIDPAEIAALVAEA